MILRTPKYFKDFHCIGSNCTDNCCIGWEIDIDKKTANFYKNVSGEFGKKLEKNITKNSPKSFILDKNERCPFLNNKNLCEIFINLGEKNLCEICTEHPRYYEWFDGIKEGGIGLCCEEAARIILSKDEKFSTIDTIIPLEAFDSYDYNIYSYLQNSRTQIISYMENQSISFNSRIRNILCYANKLQKNIDNNELNNIEISNIEYKFNSAPQSILEYFLTLEPFDKNWISYLQNCINTYNNSLHKIPEFENSNPEIFKYLQNISIYFIWRYFLKGVFDLDIISKIKLMVVSIFVIKVLFFCKWLENGKLTFEDCVEISKNYSKEIEYSEENLNSLVEDFYNIDAFSIENLINLFIK